MNWTTLLLGAIVILLYLIGQFITDGLQRTNELLEEIRDLAQERNNENLY